MEEHPDVNIYIHLPDGTQFSVEHLHFAADRCYVIPIELKMSDTIIKKTNCSLLCRLGKRVFLYSDEKPHIEAMPCIDWVTVLTAVSYTHLDVYKRQVSYSREGRRTW